MCRKPMIWLDELFDVEYKMRESIFNYKNVPIPGLDD